MSYFYIYLVFASLTAILMASRNDVCSCSQCRLYQNRYDRCECCRYIQIGKKRSVLLPPPEQADKYDNSKSDGILDINFENNANMDEKRSLWFPVSQFGNSHLVPCTSTRLQPQTEPGSDDCTQVIDLSLSKVDKTADDLLTNFLIQEKRRENSLRPLQVFFRNGGHNPQITDLVLPQSNTDAIRDISEVNRSEEELSHAKNGIIYSELRRYFPWKVISRSMLEAREPSMASENGDLFTPEGFRSHVGILWG